MAIAETTYYYVNIDNAPNGSASGTMDVYYSGQPYPIESSSITFIENYFGGCGGKYRSSRELTKSTPSLWITIKCNAQKDWGGDMRRGYSEQTFTGGPLTQLPTIHIEEPPQVINDPPYPK